jgi:EAL domain-containing protein (putative c-di-GMP-specific phosphodiesterase class I)
MLLFFLASCRGTHSDNPIIDKEKFIAILIDIHLTEASLMQSNPFEKGRTVSMIMQYDKIFEKHQVSREDFMQTFDYYRQHPKEMDELYNEITERMTIKEAEISKQSLQEQKQP